MLTDARLAYRFGHASCSPENFEALLHMPMSNCSKCCTSELSGVFHRLIQLPYGLARPDLERIRRFRRETVKGGLNMRKELEARALRLRKPNGLV
jgi:hypothetical protein